MPRNQIIRVQRVGDFQQEPERSDDRRVYRGNREQQGHKHKQQQDCEQYFLLPRIDQPANHAIRQQRRAAEQHHWKDEIQREREPGNIREWAQPAAKESVAATEATTNMLAYSAKK